MCCILVANIYTLGEELLAIHTPHGVAKPHATLHEEQEVEDIRPAFHGLTHAEDWITSALSTLVFGCELLLPCDQEHQSDSDGVDDQDDACQLKHVLEGVLV